MQEAIILIASTFSSAFITWFFTRKKQAQETKATELDNVEQATAIWRELAQDLKKQIDELQEEMSELKEEVHTYRKENQQLKKLLNKHA